MNRPPVKDWKTDWDHMDPRWQEDPFPIWDELRKTCPIAHTTRYRGVYFPTRYEDIREVAYNPNRFSSRRVAVRETDQVVNAPPVTSDPPIHREVRMPLVPPFAPKAVAALEDKTRAICNELIDGFIHRDHCDGAVDYAQHIPVRVIAHMLGISEEDGDQFRTWVTMALQDGVTDANALREAEAAMADFFAKHVKLRRQEPADDLTNYLINAQQPSGEPYTDHQILGTLRLILVAGVDTTWSAIGSALWHLASVPSDRQRLVEEPQLLPTAIEEFLRAYAPVTMAREVAQNTELSGCPMQKGQMILLSFPAANRDPAKFPNPDKVIIDRAKNPHAAFGLGIHRCIGSNLARMEMRVALETWLGRIPEFQLRTSSPMSWSQGTVRGPRLLPLTLN